MNAFPFFAVISGSAILPVTARLSVHQRGIDAEPIAAPIFRARIVVVALTVIIAVGPHTRLGRRIALATVTIGVLQTTDARVVLRIAKPRRAMGFLKALDADILLEKTVRFIAVSVPKAVHASAGILVAEARFAVGISSALTVGLVDGEITT